MSICPECGMEHGALNEKCAKCSAKEKNRKNEVAEEWVELTRAWNDIEFAMVAGLLEMAEIPALRKVEGVDGYIEIVLGVPISGIKVMVPGSRYEEALQLINAKVCEEDVEEAEMETDVEKE